MKKCDIWIAAVVCLLERNNAPAHYDKDIKKFVLESNLTTLAEKGLTPGQTVRSILGSKEVNGHAVFCPENIGYYSLWFPEEIRQVCEVQEACDLWKEKRREPQEKHND